MSTLHDEEIEDIKLLCWNPEYQMTKILSLKILITMQTGYPRGNLIVTQYAL